MDLQLIGDTRKVTVRTLHLCFRWLSGLDGWSLGTVRRWAKINHLLAMIIPSSHPASSHLILMVAHFLINRTAARMDLSLSSCWRMIRFGFEISIFILEKIFLWWPGGSTWDDFIMPIPFQFYSSQTWFDFEALILCKYLMLILYHPSVNHIHFFHFLTLDRPVHEY